MTSVDGLNAATTIDTTAVGNDTVNSGSVAELADNFRKILRSEQEGLSPELKNQSPQEKYLRALSTLEHHSLMRVTDRNMAKAIHQSSKTPESWLQTYLQSMAPESTLASAELVQDLKEFSECEDIRKYLDKNMQLVTFGDKVVVVTSPDFLKEHVMPSAMMRQCAKDLIEKRTLMDYGNNETSYYLQDEDRYNILANYFTMASASEEGGVHYSGSRIRRRIKTKNDGFTHTEDSDEEGSVWDTDMLNEDTTPSTLMVPFTLKEKLVALEVTQAKGLKLLRSEFQSHEDQLLKMVVNDLDGEKEQSEKIAAVKKQTKELADKTVQLHETSYANQRQRLIQSAQVEDSRCSIARMVAEKEAISQEIDTLRHAKQSKVDSEIAQIQRRFEVTMTEHKKQVQDLLPKIKEPSEDGVFFALSRSEVMRRLTTTQNELLHSQIANAVLVERLNLDLLKWSRVPDAIRDTVDKLHDGIWADQAKRALREMTKSYSEPAKIPIVELGLKEIRSVTTAGIQRSPAETGKGAAPASINFFPVTLHLSPEEFERGKRLRLQTKTDQQATRVPITRQDRVPLERRTDSVAFDSATTEPKHTVEVRTDTDDNYYEDRDGDENLSDQDGVQSQPASYSAAVAKSSTKRPRNDGSSSAPAPQAKKSASDPYDYKGKKIYQGSMKVIRTSIQGWLSDGGLFRPAPAIKPKADDTSLERDDQSKAIMLIYKAHIAWGVVNVEVSPNLFTTLNQLGRERRLDWSEPRYKLLNEEQLSKLNSRLMNDNTFITEDTAAHLRFYKKCEPASSKGKDKGKGKGNSKGYSSRSRVYDDPDKFEYFPNSIMSFSQVYNAIQMDPSGQRPKLSRSQITWPREGEPPTSRQIDMMYRYWDYLPRTLNKFVLPTGSLKHAFQELGRGYYIGYSMALLGLDTKDTECERMYIQRYHSTLKEDPRAVMEKPGVVFAAGALASPHWTGPAIKLEDRNVKHLLKQYVHEIDEVQSHIDNEAHEMLFQVLLRHKKRLVTVYKVIAEDHGFITLGRIDKKPSRAQKALRQGADLASSTLETGTLSQNDDTTMASSTNEPTAQEKAARKE